MPPSPDTSITQLQSLAKGLPFKELDIPEFKNPKFEPEKIRQERQWTRADASAQAIGRFLAECGVVELLKPEMTFALFHEIHWCCWRIRTLAQAHYKNDAVARNALMDARRLVSRFEAAEEELFIANRRLVVACTKPFFWIGQIWLSDFLQEGARALSNAIRKFDHTRGTPFFAYAQKSIQNRLRNYLRDHIRSGNLNVHLTEEMLKVKQISDKWKEEHGEAPTAAILAKITQLPEQKINRFRPLITLWERMPTPPVSLDILVGESESSLHEIIEDNTALQAFDEAEKSEVWMAVDRLPERTANILRLRFMEGHTLEEVGDMIGLTRARIKQIQDQGLAKLRRILRKNNL